MPRVTPPCGFYCPQCGGKTVPASDERFRRLQLSRSVNNNFAHKESPSHAFCTQRAAICICSVRGKDVYLHPETGLPATVLIAE